MTDNELKDECIENAEIDLRRYSNNELMKIREAMRMYADRKLKLFGIPAVIKSVCVHPYEKVHQSETECYCEICGHDFTEQTVL